MGTGGPVQQGPREVNKYTHLCGARGGPVQQGHREVNKYTQVCGGFEAMDDTRPYEFIRFGAMDVTKAYNIYMLWWMSPNPINL